MEWWNTDVVVYAMCKNESKFVNRWLDSMQEATAIAILDTGSTDNTVGLITQWCKEHDWNIYNYKKTSIVPERVAAHTLYLDVQEITPWRFDVARNKSLDLIPAKADICFCVDLDEVFEPGWYKTLCEQWTPQTNRATYRYTWNFTKTGEEGVVYWADKCHSRDSRWRWAHPVHETLEWQDSATLPVITKILNLQVNHHADNTKPRSSYLPLLELSVEEDSTNDRNMHYLGREYMFYGQWENCIKTLKRHLELPSATWADERAASMRFIANSYTQLGNVTEAVKWLHKAIAEAAHVREAYIQMAKLLYTENNWTGVIYFVNEALKITTRPDTYINEEASWTGLPYDLLSIAYYGLGMYKLSIEAAEKALSYDPEDERIKKNIELVRAELAAL